MREFAFIEELVPNEFAAKVRADSISVRWHPLEQGSALLILQAPGQFGNGTRFPIALIPGHRYETQSLPDFGRIERKVQGMVGTAGRQGDPIESFCESVAQDAEGVGGDRANPEQTILPGQLKGVSIDENGCNVRGIEFP